MKNYTFNVTYTFTGTVDVRAKNKEQAREIVNRDFGPVSPSYGASNHSNNKDEEGIVDWDCDIHPVKSTIK